MTGRQLRLLLFLLAVFAVGPSFAQAPTGTIAGVISDASGAMVANAPVAVTNKETGASRHTISCQWEEGISHSDACESQQKLTTTAEKVLADWITHLTATGHPTRHNFIRKMAEEIRNQGSDI